MLISANFHASISKEVFEMGTHSFFLAEWETCQQQAVSCLLNCKQWLGGVHQSDQIWSVGVNCHLGCQGINSAKFKISFFWLFFFNSTLKKSCCTQVCCSAKIIFCQVGLLKRASLCTVIRETVLEERDSQCNLGMLLNFSFAKIYDGCSFPYRFASPHVCAVPFNQPL